MKVEVKVTHAFEHYYGAVAFVDGTRTSLDCGHNHHTAKAAVKCIKAVQARCGLFEDPNVTSVEMRDGNGDRMVEYRWSEMKESRFTGPWLAEVRQRVSFVGEAPRV